MAIINQKNAALEYLVQRFFMPESWVPVLGAEQEFYCNEAQSQQLETWKNIPEFYVQDIVKEEGQGQWEAHFRPTKDPAQLATAIQHFRESTKVITHTKPFKDQPSSALHLHLHLENAQGENLFEKQGEEESSFMLYAIAGLLETMPEAIKTCLPTQEDFTRLGDHLHTPTTISWGGNNRSTAIRIPDKTPRRIEYRLASSNADPFAVIAAVLAGAGQGLAAKQLPKLPKIYGNANSQDYPDLQPLDYNVRGWN